MTWSNKFKSPTILHITVYCGQNITFILHIPTYYSCKSRLYNVRLYFIYCLIVSHENRPTLAAVLIGYP